MAQLKLSARFSITESYFFVLHVISAHYSGKALYFRLNVCFGGIKQVVIQQASDK